MMALSFWGWCCWYNDEGSKPTTKDRVLYILLIIATLVCFPFMLFVFWPVALIYYCVKKGAIEQEVTDRLQGTKNKE